MIDWVIRYVSNNVECACCGTSGWAKKGSIYAQEYFANAYTEGLTKYGQKELVSCIDISPELVATMLNSLGLRVQSGKDIFTEGIRLDILAHDDDDKEYPVQFITFDNDDRLYIIWPDENGKLPMDNDCLEPFSLQYKYAEQIHNEYMEEPSDEDFMDHITRGR